MRLAIAIAAAAAALLGLTPALAAEPRFATASATVTADGDLRVRWNERGLEPGTTIEYRVTANGFASYACQNNGGQFPGNQTTTKVNEPVEALIAFDSGERKNIRAAIELPVPESGLSCPNGQTVTLVCAAYSQIRLRDVTNGVLRRLGQQAQNFFAGDFPDC